MGPRASQATTFSVKTTINPVNIEKSIVLVREGVWTTNGDLEGDYFGSGWLISSTTLVIGARTWGGTYVYWQVIEFN